MRLAGDDVAAVLNRLGIGMPDSPSRVTASIDLGDPYGVIDVAVLVWPTRRSYTGTPAAEIHTLACTPLLNAVVRRLVNAGARPARPGEFTLRAFLAGRLDLVQAEAVLSVIDAETPETLGAALDRLAGGISRPLASVREDLLNLLADIEAGLDFVDEDIEFVDAPEVLRRLAVASKVLGQTRETLGTRRDDDPVVAVAIRGYPNAGKSSLANRLSASDGSIVSPTAGTTRDVVAVDAVIGPHRVRLFDTAGIEATDDDPNATTPTASIDLRTSMNRQGRAAESASRVRLWCVDGSDPRAVEVVARIDAMVGTDSPNDLRLWTKSDIGRPPPGPAWIETSVMTDDGMLELRRRLTDLLNRWVRTGGEASPRVHDALNRAIAAVEDARRLQVGEPTSDGEPSAAMGGEYVGDAIRRAVEAVGEITGAVYTDDLLDRVFSRFCIGK